MTKEHKTNWECRICLVKKSKSSSNVTQRQKKPLKAPSPSTTLNLCDSIDMSANETLNRSCPENCTHVKEDIEELKNKILNLEAKLESADTEIERLLADNYNLNKLLSKRDAKINQLTIICRSTPKRSNIADIPRSSSKDKEEVDSSATENNSPILLENRKNVITSEAIKSPSHQTKKIASCFTSPSSLNSPPADMPQSPRIQETRIPKICLISTDRINKTYTIAKNTLKGDYDVCHHLLPNRGIRQLFHGIKTKLEDFTLEDYCIVLMGKEDFNVTENYYDLVVCIREALQDIVHTHVILCVPTFKHGRYTDLFNSRVERFNALLGLDAETHQYAYLIDSNLNLNYDYTMFRTSDGIINNRGLNQVMTDVNEKLLMIQNWYKGSDSENHQLCEAESITELNKVSCKQTNFFRQQY